MVLLWVELASHLKTVVVVDERNILQLVLSVKIGWILLAQFNVRHRVFRIDNLRHQLAKIIVYLDLLDADFFAYAGTSGQTSDEGACFDDDIVESSAFMLFNALELSLHECACLFGLLVAEWRQKSIRMIRVLVAVLWSAVCSFAVSYNETISYGLFHLIHHFFHFQIIFLL